MRGEARIQTSKTLIGTFDILGARSMFEATDANGAESVVSLIIRTMSDSIDGTIQKLQSLYKEVQPDGGRLKDLIERTSSYFYADTIVYICDISEFDQIMMCFACEYFQFIAIEITRRMFAFGLPVRGCLSHGTIARYTDHNKIVVSGKSYAETIKIADNLEFSGTVLTEELCEVIQECDNAVEIPPLQYRLRLPCTVKNRKDKAYITNDMWCLDWIDDTDFLEERHDIRQLIFDSFTKHGKKVGDSVIGKIDNTETIVRMLIAHRKAGAQ